MTASVRSMAFALVLSIAGGCSERPKAPPLVNDTVYQNDKIGLRFLAPEGWSISTRADLPETLPKPIILVAYQLTKGESHSEFQVLAADLPEGADYAAFLLEHRIGAAGWTVSSLPQIVSINGKDATRLVLSRKAGKNDIRREATAFRRQGRVFFFVLTFAASDTASRDAARQCVQSATWAN